MKTAIRNLRMAVFWRATYYAALLQVRTMNHTASFDSPALLFANTLLAELRQHMQEMTVRYTQIITDRYVLLFINPFISRLQNKISKPVFKRERQTL